MTDDRSLWYISFASEDGFLGAIVVMAIDAAGAIDRANQLGINPGGEAAIIEIPPDCEEALTMLNRLALEPELRAAGGKKLSEMTGDQRAEFTEMSEKLCEDCNTGKPHVH
jgi:hypothetical protein